MPIGSDFHGTAIPNETRRLKRFLLPHREFLTCFGRFDRWPDIIQAVERPEIIPADAKVHGVYLDYSRQGYYIIVEHPSYDEVDLGAEIPIGCNTVHKIIGLRVIDRSVAIPMNLSKQVLTEMFSEIVNQLEIIEDLEAEEGTDEEVKS